MSANPSQPGPDARAIWADLRALAVIFESQSDEPRISLGQPFVRSAAVAVRTAADALEAFRAVAEALLRCEGVTLSTPKRSEVCTYCSAPARHRKGSTCPVALARAAMERFPEVTT